MMDDISLSIGELRAGQHAAQQQQSEMLGALRSIQAQLAQLPGLVRDVAEMKPHVNDYRKLKQRFVGAAVTIGLGSGGLGALLTHLMHG